MLGVASDRTKCLCAGTVIEVASGQLSVILMTLVLGVASDRTKCLYGGSVGFGPWAHGMALDPLGGPDDESPPKCHSHDFGVRRGQ